MEDLIRLYTQIWGGGGGGGGGGHIITSTQTILISSNLQGYAYLLVTAAIGTFLKYEKLK